MTCCKMLIRAETANGRDRAAAMQTKAGSVTKSLITTQIGLRDVNFRMRLSGP